MIKFQKNHYFDIIYYLNLEKVASLTIIQKKKSHLMHDWGISGLK